METHTLEEHEENCPFLSLLLLEGCQGEREITLTLFSSFKGESGEYGAQVPSRTF